MQEICGCTVEIPTRFFTCINDELAVYSIKLADQIFYIVSLLLSNMLTAKIDLGIASLSACNKSCDGLLEEIKESLPNHKHSNDYTQKLAPVSVLFAVLPVIFIVPLIIYCTCRYVLNYANRYVWDIGIRHVFFALRDTHFLVSCFLIG